MQRNKLFLLLASITIIALCGIVYTYFSPSTENKKITGDDEAMSFNLSAREAWNLNRLKDPATGQIPDAIRQKELAFAATLPKVDIFRKSSDLWVPLGPYNVGGRTRAIAIDVNNENILLAGSASGGIWRSENGGQSWEKTTSNTEITTITSIAQDTRDGKTNNWYATTGERLGSSASKTGAFFTGNGFLKSTDNGKTWKPLATTAVNTPQFDFDFDLGWNITVNPVVKDKDAVFAAIYGGVYRSNNGGDTWQRMRGGRLGGNSSQYTDVVITTTGVIYATLSSEGPQKGIWRSTDNGDTWADITPANFPSTYERMVIGIVPQFENQIYILALTPGKGQMTKDFQGTEEWNSLWKYTYVSGNGTGAAGAWEDRSAGIPNGTGEFEPFNAQGAYNYLVRVHPADTNIVIIGGSSLFRSGDGFKTQNKLQRIGGYALGTKRPDFQIYANHHPDQHNLIFFASNPNKVISTHDGGISITSDIKKDVVEWQSLNNGYATTQFYTVAINQSKANDNVVIGGLQDNGTLLTDKFDRKNPWSLIFSYDGAFCHVANNGKDFYVAKQQAGLYRIQLDAQNKRQLSARLDPAGFENADYDFINPWCVNPNDDKQVYMLVKGGVIRNTDVTQVPLSSFLDSSRKAANWENITSTFGGDKATAVSMSTNPPNILFYGTEGGKVFRVSNAHTGQPAAVDITGSSMVAANINNICVHPDDADKLIAVITNYGVRSLFYTDDGGKNWVDISGNLEENANGSGNGPSCRWAAFIKTENDYGVLVATSVGLFGTPALNGVNTTWVLQSPDVIGNAICEMIKVRPSDNKVVVATHGAGVYTANLSKSYQLTGIKEQAKKIEFTIYPNPATESISVTIADEAAKNATISIYNLQGKKLITRQSETANTKLAIDLLAAGTYLLRIETGSASASQFFIKK